MTGHDWHHAAHGLYEPDAIGRAVNGVPTGQVDPDLFGGPLTRGPVHLGPLDINLLPYRLPRVPLIDELDKSDIDLPNDRLKVFVDDLGVDGDAFGQL